MTTPTYNRPPQYYPFSEFYEPTMGVNIPFERLLLEHTRLMINAFAAIRFSTDEPTDENIKVAEATIKRMTNQLEDWGKLLYANLDPFAIMNRARLFGKFLTSMKAYIDHIILYVSVAYEGISPGTLITLDEERTHLHASTKDLSTAFSHIFQSVPIGEELHDPKMVSEIAEAWKKHVKPLMGLGGARGIDFDKRAEDAAKNAFFQGRVIDGIRMMYKRHSERACPKVEEESPHAEEEGEEAVAKGSLAFL